MLNELHYSPASRATLHSLLPLFKKHGFTNLAIETFSYKDSTKIPTRGYPVTESGYYQREPIFGELFRQALALEYNLISYESEIECNNWEHPDQNYCNRFRDSLQAVNLAQWVKAHPQEKLLVYAGHDHIYEKNLRAAGSIWPSIFRSSAE